ncbi:hypothetical protein [Streptomyces wuyuanensis]|uniref:Uncharacterized protein n=1 Tax=Streptomyces wuyuanensis TaxID=1196353 RepID=A0A1G9ZC90_9ACTN|nr:hypothetical protein [Streptomyces wuyuanensis]SDN19012.1 hypothetical protein SAMN05444921_12185 [Streptomyces wuyuanensis]
MSDYQAQLAADKAEGQRQADEFNRRFPIGTPVIAYPLTRPEDNNPGFFKQLETVTRTPAWILGHGEPVVSVEGYSGGICLTHVDVAPRTNTPDVVTVNDLGRKSTTSKLKRACNGCGQLLGDVDNRDVDQNGNLTDVRHECPTCQPLLELEAEGCKTWQLTQRNIGDIDDAVDRDGIYAKGYWETVDGKLTVTGLRIGAGPDRIVAKFGDFIIRHPDGNWSTRKAVAA